MRAENLLNLKISCIIYSVHTWKWKGGIWFKIKKKHSITFENNKVRCKFVKHTNLLRPHTKPTDF